MRLIDADKLPKYDGYALNADAVAQAVENAPTIEPIITDEQVKEYCRKRCFVVVDSELFNEMKARWTEATHDH